jgi:hypothetical protein
MDQKLLLQEQQQNLDSSVFLNPQTAKGILIGFDTPSNLPSTDKNIKLKGNMF